MSTAAKQPSSSGLEGVVAADTCLSDVDGERGRLTIAGHDVEKLALAVTFEDAVALLATGNSYILEASSDSGDRIHGPQFVADELAALKKGEILTAAGPLDEAGFAQMVSSYCG